MKPPGVTIGSFLTQTTAQLTRAGISTARLDCLVLLQHTLGKDKAWLLSHQEHLLLPTQQRILTKTVAQRVRRVPLAYIIGNQEFFGRQFFVTSNVLVPRPETEALVEITKTLKPTSILDVGTGSGAIAITLYFETAARISACDLSPAALALARRNAKKLGARVAFKQSDLLQATNGTFDCIVANLPYVSRNWQRSPETNYEPSMALFARNKGLSLIFKLLAQAPQHLKEHGYLILEADPRQHLSITNRALRHTLNTIKIQGFALLLQKQ